MGKKVALSMILLLLLVVLAACNISSDNGETSHATESQEETTGVDTLKPADSEVVWTLPDYGIRLNTETLNRKLLADGYDFQLTVNYQSEAQEQTYQDQLKTLLLEGKTDIAFLGTASSEMADDNIARMVRDGCLLDLTEYLHSKDGISLYNAFYEELWHTVLVDEQLCVLPNQVATNGTSFFAFNKDIFTEADLQGFDGTAQALKSLMNEKKISAMSVIWDLDARDIAFMAGQEYRLGVLFDLQTGEVRNIFESQEFMRELNAISSLMEEGYFGTTGEFYKMNNEQHDEMIRKREFSVWAGIEYADVLNELEEDVIIVQLPYAFFSRLTAGTGVSSQAPHRENALKLLNLLYTNVEYSNLLIWGEEGSDYQIEDGLAQALSDNAKGIFVKEFLLGVYDQVLPTAGDYFPVNREETKQALFSSTMRKTSVMTGFQEDLSGFDEDMKKLDNVSNTMIEAYILGRISAQELEQGLRDAKTDMVKEELQKQVTVWLEN